MRIIFIGSVQFSEKALEKLLEIQVDVAGVCTLDKSTFNADHVDLTPFCIKRNIPVKCVNDINSKTSFDWIKSHDPDVIFCFGWSRLLKRPLLELAPMGVIGCHGTNLPANRGRHPQIWSLVLGLKDTASTFFFMDEGADSGDILSQYKLKIFDKDDATTLYQRITETALTQIEEFVPKLRDGDYQRTPQDNSAANTWRKRGQNDGKIDWRMSAQSIHNLVRGLTRPYVGAHFVMNEREVKVWKSKIIRNRTRNIEPGKVLSVKEREIVVKAGEDSICLLELEPICNIQKGDYL